MTILKREYPPSWRDKAFLYKKLYIMNILKTKFVENSLYRFVMSADLVKIFLFYFEQ